MTDSAMNATETSDIPWPVSPGAYALGDPRAPVAVCTLTSNDLMHPLATLPGVAIAGRLYTPNLGVEKIVVNVTANPAIRFLLLCGKESPLFHPGQALRALVSAGVTPEREIVGAEGYQPTLKNVPLARIEAFRRQVELVDCVGETDVVVLGERIAGLAARTPGPAGERWAEGYVGDAGATLPYPPPSPEMVARMRAMAGSAEGAAAHAAHGMGEGSLFASIRPGGRREPLAYDPKGFFVITLDREAGEILCRHYQQDNTPAHEMRGHSAEAMLLGLLREELVTQLSHAGYLGGELAKAEAALRLALRYEQDQPLRRASA